MADASCNDATLAGVRLIAAFHIMQATPLLKLAALIYCLCALANHAAMGQTPPPTT